MTFHSPKDYLDEARSPQTTVDRLDVLAKKEWEFVRAAVAENRNTTVETLMSLFPPGAKQIDESIAVALARRIDAPPDLLRRLSERFGRTVDWSGRSVGFTLGLALLANAGTPTDVVNALLDPERSTGHFRGRAVTETSRLDVLDLLKNDIKGKVRARAERKLEALRSIEERVSDFTGRI